MFDPTNPMGTNYNDPFSSPMNPINMTPGNWGVDPMYLTPGYTANYRPQYQGPEGYATSSYQPGFGEAAHRLSYLPTAPRAPLYFDPVQYHNTMFDSISTKTMDSVASGMQFAAPIAAYLGAEAALNRKVRINRPDTISKMGGAWTSMWGGSNSEVIKARHSRSMAGLWGSNIGRGAVGATIGGTARGLGFSSAAAKGSMIGRAAMGAGAVVGGAAGAIALPLLAGAAIAKGADSMFFDPYIATRQGQDALTRNFSNQYFSSGANPINGYGLSSSVAADIAGSLTNASIHDRAFDDAGSYGKIADYASRSGLLNDIGAGDSNTITKRIKGIAEQVKVVMAVANEPSVQEAVQMLAKLKQGGATDQGGFAGTVMRNIQNSAAMSGMSVQNMMNTVGANGQYLYQSQGLTPFVGMQNAAGMHAGFASAFKAGLIDPGLMARMGGMQGMTQSAMEAQVQLASSNYNMMGLANKYMFGQDGTGNVSGNIGNFGKNFAKDPLSTMGYMNMFGKDMISSQLKNDPSAVLDQVFEFANLMPGKNDPGKIAYMMQMQGLSGSQIRSTMEMLRSYSDPDSVRYMKGALEGNFAKQRMDYLSQNGLAYGDTWMSNAYLGTSRAWRNVKGATSDAMSSMVSGFSALGEDISKSINTAMYGDIQGDMYRVTGGQRITGDDLLSGKMTQHRIFESPVVEGSSLGSLDRNSIHARSQLLRGRGVSNRISYRKALSDLRSVGNFDPILRALNRAAPGVRDKAIEAIESGDTNTMISVLKDMDPSVLQQIENERTVRGPDTVNKFGGLDKGTRFDVSNVSGIASALTSDEMRGVLSDSLSTSKQDEYLATTSKKFEKMTNRKSSSYSDFITAMGLGGDIHRLMRISGDGDIASHLMGSDGNLTEEGTSLLNRYNSLMGTSLKPTDEGFADKFNTSIQEFGQRAAASNNGISYQMVSPQLDKYDSVEGALAAAKNNPEKVRKDLGMPAGTEINEKTVAAYWEASDRNSNSVSTGMSSINLKGQESVSYQSSLSTMAEAQNHSRSIIEHMAKYGNQMSFEDYNTLKSSIDTDNANTYYESSKIINEAAHVFAEAAGLDAEEKEKARAEANNNRSSMLGNYVNMFMQKNSPTEGGNFGITR